MARELKVGDRVRCCDGSYIFGIRSGAFSTFISNVNGDRDDLRVIAVGLRIDNQNEPGWRKMLDVLVTDDAGNYWFMPSEFCKLLPKMHTITIDNKDIEISDESFESLKRQLT